MNELKAVRGGEIYNIIEFEDCYRIDDLYYPKSDADKAIAEKDFIIKMMRRHIYELKLADAIEKMNFWVAQKFWWDSLKDKVTTKPLFDYSAKAETWTNRVEKYKAKLKELR